MADALRVLLVEDNEGDVEMTQRALRDSKPACDISVANDGLEALSFLMKEGSFAAAQTPQLILLDLNMPRMDGKKFLERIKSDAQFKAIPVVMLTSSESPSDVRACYERYASGYVVKPFDAKDFATRLKQVIGFWGEVGRLPN
jgi:CheY-like chemotaxis protein